MKMDYASIRNLETHVTALAHTNFILITEKWVAPKGLTIGCHTTIQMLNNVAGSRFEPIKPAFILNADYSIQRYCSSIVKCNTSSNQWFRVTADIL